MCSVSVNVLHTTEQTVHTDIIHHQHINYAYVRCADRVRLAGKHQQSNFSLNQQLLCTRSCALEEAWLWTAICREGGIVCFQC